MPRTPTKGLGISSQAKPSSCHANRASERFSQIRLPPALWWHHPDQAFKHLSSPHTRGWIRQVLPTTRSPDQAAALGLAHDRREALPLPLAILAAWESHIAHCWAHSFCVRTVASGLEQALVCLRWAIQLPWLSEGGQLVTQQEAGAFTLHSLKRALLSAAAQLQRKAGDCRDIIAFRRHCCAAETIQSKPCGCNWSWPSQSGKVGALLAPWPERANAERHGIAKAPTRTRKPWQWSKQPWCRRKPSRSPTTSRFFSEAAGPSQPSKAPSL